MSVASYEKLARFVYEARKRKGLSQPDLTKRGGPSAGWIGSLEAGTLSSVPKPSTLRKLSDALGVPLAEVMEAADEFPVGIPPIDGIKLTRGTPPPAMAKMPFAGEVGCGRKLELESVGFLELPEDVAARGDFAVRAEGDSMNRLGIHEGDILIIRSTRRAKEGQIVVANILYDGSTCKRLKRFGKLAYLVPESYNTAHEPIAVTEDVAILGVVTYIHRPGIPLE